MIHRHLDTNEWTLAAIDSAIEYGDLADWRELFHAAAQDEKLARRILHIVNAHPVDGGSALAKNLIEKRWPGAAPQR